MAHPRALVALCLVLLAGLSWLGDVRGLPRITPGEAPSWEGQAVRVSGWAADVRRDPDGGQRLSLRLARHALDAQAAVGDVEPGDWVAASGRLARLGGRLVLLADELDVVRGPAPLQPDWGELAADPQAWSGQPLRLQGTIDDGHLADGAGHALPLGVGPWPPTGPADLVATLAYDASCLCHRLDAVGPAWTP